MSGSVAVKNRFRPFVQILLFNICADGAAGVFAAVAGTHIFKEDKKMSTQFNLEAMLQKKGTKTTGFINIAQKPDSSWVRIPYMIAVGEKDGPTLLVDCGTHGDEYEGGEGIAKAFKSIDTKDLSGALVCVPALNFEAYAIGNRVASSIDWSYRDMNRAFPGNENGFITERVVAYYMKNIVSKANWVISFHGGGNGLYLEPLCAYNAGNSDVAKTTRQMAVAFGAQVLWRETDLPFGGVMALECEKIGVPCAMPELGGQSTRHGLREYNVNLAANGILNVMKEFKMLPGKVTYRTDFVDVDIEYIHSNNGGIHRIQKKPLEPCKKGDVLATICDVFGNKVEEVIAPYDGTIIGYWAYAMIQPGNWSIMYGKYVK